MEAKQRVFSHQNIHEKCAWLRGYPGFDVPKTAGSRFRATLSKLPSRSQLSSTQQTQRKETTRDGALTSQMLESRRKEEDNSYMRYYSPQQHKFVKEKVGEIQLPVPIFQLVPPVMETHQSERTLNLSLTRNVVFNHAPAQNLLRELKTFQLQFQHRPLNHRKALLRSLRDLRSMNFTPEDIAIYQSHYNTVPYELPKSREFLTACKCGDTWTARRLLELNPYLVLVFDSTHETALHWAAKRNHTEIIKLLIKWKAQINARDQSGQTPLYHAAKVGSFDAVRDLCCLKADARRETLTGDTAIRVCKDPAVYMMLKRAILLDIFLKYAPREKRDTVWREEGLKYFHLDVKILRRRR